jgi:Alpha amylase, catalytic domain
VADLPARRRGPLLYQLNTRILLQERGRALGRPATLDDVPDALLDEIKARGFDWVWFLGVWTTGPAARAVSRGRRDWREGFARDLPDLREDDITGSPFAIQAYDVAPEYGGDAALARVRERLARRGLRLLLDFVPNHVSPDHPWTRARPEYFIEGTADDLAREPQNWVRLGGRVLAHGRDPYFPGWPDTVQLNYLHPGLREAMRTELSRVAARCDGVRCDMAMLVLPDVFRRTWGDRATPRDGSATADQPFWPEAIARVKVRTPGFLFMAEVYWDLEWTLQQQGFDFTYDKRLYDRLHAGDARPVREHLWAAAEFQERSARFLENHDEPRAAAVFGPEQERAAAVISFLVPGLRFFHEGQLEGRKVHVSMHLGRRPDEPPDRELRAFYERLLAVLAREEVHDGAWRLSECRAAWPENPTWDRFVVMAWEGAGGRRLLAAVNYGPTRAQCWAQVPFAGLGRKVVLQDLLGETRYERDGAELGSKGLYLDLPPWGRHAFALV